MKLATTLAALAVVSLAGCGAVPSAATVRTASASSTASAAQQATLLYGANIVGTITKAAREQGRPVLTVRVEEGDYKGTLVLGLLASKPEELAAFKVGVRVKGFVGYVKVDQKRRVFVNDKQGSLPSAIAGLNFGVL